MTPISRNRALPAALAAALAPAGLAAQLAIADADPRPAAPAAPAMTTATPGAAYAAGRLHRTLLGEGYRQLWGTPVAVEVLDLSRFAGGLTPTRTGGDFSTRSLRFRGADGREYVFRSVDKDATQGLHPDLRNTVVDGVVQDQVSVVPPTGVLVASALQTAAGVMHAPPRLVVMPDHPALGAFRADFAGMLGTLEERPGDADEGPAFAGAVKVASSTTLLERLQEGPEHSVDSRAYLNARLLDLVMGDWDRHDDQWRWARYDVDGGHVWRPIARDRDNAFARHGGVLLSAVRGDMPKLVSFGPAYPPIRGLTESAQLLDRRLLSGLPREAWDAASAALAARLTDEVIEAAVRRLPPEHYARVGAEMAAALRARRDALPRAAAAFYHQVAEVVDVHGTDAAETARVDRLADGSLEVRLVSANGATTFRRRFYAGETREVRLHLYGGDDAAHVAGHAEASPLVRVISGAGDDVLVDSSRVGGGRRTVFHDAEGANRIDAGTGAAVDLHPYSPPPAAPRIDNLPAERDRGASRNVDPWVGYGAEAGPMVGASMTWTRYGFRSVPFASRARLRVEVAPLDPGVALDYRRTSHGSRGSMLTVHARASQVDAFRFHGLGNDSEGGGPRDRYVAPRDVLALEGEWSRPVAAGVRVGAGPVLRYVNASPDAGTPLALAAGGEAYGTAGIRTTLAWDRRDAATFPRRGGWVLLAGEAHRGVSGAADETFGRASGEGGAYLPVAGATTLAVRAGGERVWGGFPVQEAAFLGGTGSLRGYTSNRFAGDASLWGNAEIRAPLGRANLRLARGNMGALLLADAGRVYMDGESAGGWHTAYGGGVWFSMIDGAYTATLLAARGEEGWRAHLRLGLPF